MIELKEMRLISEMSSLWPRVKRRVRGTLRD